MTVWIDPYRDLIANQMGTTRANHRKSLAVPRREKPG
jgi:hypothetical protein